jgi:hypothetical protein
MSKFSYGSGARPLDGYVIKRGIGQGGFGEVYYALSDAGKEVALKLVRGNQDVELRGMQHCLNLKHPNLVTLYDIRKGADGEVWVVMEYVAGDNLSDLLHQHPHGLPLDLAQKIFTDLAKAVGYLHENGIVHRDLKPANIFLEKGVVKVGDYGLAKSISGSQKSPQTQSVGTVHYMAPEISTGNYGKQIDVYAAAVILFEMVTGRPPFDGETAGEILMKHLTATPDLSKLPPILARVVGRGLAKDPKQRYASLTEMLADWAGQQPPSGALPVTQSYQQRPSPSAVKSTLVQGPPLPVFGWRAKVQEVATAMGLTVVWSGLAMLIWAALDRPRGGAPNLAEFAANLNLTVLGVWAVLLPSKLFWEGRTGDPWTQRSVLMTLGLGLGLLSAWLHPPVGFLQDLTDAESSTQFLWHLTSGALFFGGAFFAVRWPALIFRYREKRFSLLAVAWTALLGYGLSLWFDNQVSWTRMPSSVGVVLVMAIVVQLVSPWSETPRVAERPRRLRYA